MNVKSISLAAAVVASLGVASIANAVTVTSTMPVKIIIQDACNVTTTAPTALDFGTQGLLTANIDQTSTITVACTSGATFNIGLDGGAEGAAAVTARKMAFGTNKVSYQLYLDSARSSNWGNTVGTNTKAGTGTGSPVAFTVYGRVSPQATPPAGTYNDTVNVTVTY